MKMRNWLLAFGLWWATGTQAQADLANLPPMNFTIVINKPNESLSGGFAISCGSHCREIYADGPIDEHAPDRLETLIQQQHLPDRTMIYLNSPGGSLYGGIELGRVLRRHKMGVNVAAKDRDHADCISACTLAYMGGLFRWMAPSADYGIHRFFNDEGVTVKDPMAEAQVVSGDIAAYLHEMGISPEFLTAMSRIASENYLVLGMETLHALGIVNGGVVPTQWTIDIYSGTYSLHAKQETVYGLDVMMFACPAHQLLLVVSMQRDGLPPWSAVAESLQLDNGQFYELHRLNHDFSPAKPGVITTTMINTYEVPFDALPKIAQAKRISFQILPGGPVVPSPLPQSGNKDVDELMDRWDQLAQTKYFHDASDAPWSFEVHVLPSEHDRVAGFIDRCR
jgi:hypothetical protein